MSDLISKASIQKEDASIQNSKVRTYTFVKEAEGWYIDLPEYLAHGGSKADLQMVAGADEMLETMAAEKSRITMAIDTEPFEGADLVELIELCEVPPGGGYYLMHTSNGKTINKKMWLCDVTLFVFGDMPERIYVKKITS